MKVLMAGVMLTVLTGVGGAAPKIIVYKMTESQCKEQGGRVVGDYPPVCRDDEISLGLVSMKCPCACCVTAKMPRPKTNEAPKDLLAQLPAPDSAMIASIRDIQLWRNPQLIVKPDGVEVFFRSTVPAADILSRLSSLPTDAWPYGRVVALTEQSIRSKGDGPKIQRNLRKVLEMLKEGKIRVERFPSA